MEKGFVKIKGWMIGFSWCYGGVVRLRNFLFDKGILKSNRFKIPIISVGNITTGGSGKTPFVEYLINLLEENFQVAVLSRGYKRKSKGYVLAKKDTKIFELGDEAYWLRKKHPEIHVAVDKNRCHAIEKIIGDEITSNTDVILLDDAFQHRYITPGISILLIDYHRQLVNDKLLPAGHLREPKSGIKRADIVIITKCPRDLQPLRHSVIAKSMNLLPKQQLYFATLEYGALKPVYYGVERELESIDKEDNVMLLTGIALPEQIIYDMKPYFNKIAHVSFPDHHQFSKDDIKRINQTYREMPYPKIVITTEKDNIRMFGMEGISDEIRHNIYILPVKVKFLMGQEEEFNNKIISYVRENSRNSILAKSKDDDKSQDSNNLGDGPRTTSHGNN
ncbi:MAG: tetraacyldisaccharide 4'-kinase [Prevotella sp.]|nr:tetraacyldisaccharide 4'-kinase [Prevotella sp.]